MFSLCHGGKVIPNFIDVQENGRAYAGTSWASHLYLNEDCEDMRFKHAVISKNWDGTYYIESYENAPLFLNGKNIQNEANVSFLKNGDVVQFGNNSLENPATYIFNHPAIDTWNSFLPGPLVEYLEETQGASSEVLKGLTTTSELRFDTNFAILLLQENLLEQIIDDAHLDYLFVEVFDLLAADHSKAVKCKMILRVLCRCILYGGANMLDIVADEDDIYAYFDRIMVHDCHAPKKRKMPRAMHAARVFLEETV